MAPPSPLLYNTVRRGKCQLCDTMPPTFVRLTRRALEGGRRNPRMGENTFSMTAQGYTVTSGQRERSSPSLSALCGHPCHCSITPGTVTTSPTLLEHTGTGHRHDRPLYLVRPPVDSTLGSARGRRPGDQPLRCYPRSRSCMSTGLAMTPQLERDSLGWSSTLRYCSPYLYT
jgi:hypothetical protein